MSATATVAKPADASLDASASCVVAGAAGRTPVHRPITGVALVDAPAVLFVGVFVLVPLAFALVISLTNWPLIGSVKFSG